MTIKDPKDQDLPRPISDFFRRNYDYDGLWLPFTEYVAPVKGSSEGHKLANSEPRLLQLEGSWVVEETTDNGYPAVLRTEARDAAVSAVLNVQNASAIYTSALVGYSSEMGSFMMGMLPNRRSLPKEFATDIPCYADCCTFERIKQVLTDSTKQTPIAIVRSSRTKSTDQQTPSYGPYSRTYLWYNAAGHNPWEVLNQTKLDTYSTLISRYKVAADAVNKPFNETPPANRERSAGDPEKGAELQEMVQEMYGTDE